MGPDDHTTKRILEFINTYVGFTATEVRSLAQNQNKAIRRDYTSRRLTRSFRNRRRQNERLWSRFAPHDFKCIYCRDELTLYPNLVGARSDVRLLPCCCLLAHRECHRQAVSRNGKCPECQSMFDSEGRIDVDTDCLHSTLLRNEIRDAHCIPRCYPRHNHRRCHLFAHLPTHRPRHSGRVNDPY